MPQPGASNLEDAVTPDNKDRLIQQLSEQI
jgi:hypothetical protein